MITRIEITGFKSFHNFEMDFTPLTVITGDNSSGKSNLLDAFRLLRNLANNDVRTAFKLMERGDPKELFTYYNSQESASKMTFAVELLLDRIVKDAAGETRELVNTRLRYELELQKFTDEVGFQYVVVSHEVLEKIPDCKDFFMQEQVVKDNYKLLRPRGGNAKKFFISTVAGKYIARHLDGVGGRSFRTYDLTQPVKKTILSSVDIDHKHAFAVRQEMRQWQLLDLKCSHLVKPTSRKEGFPDHFTSTGEHLASVLFRMGKEDPTTLKRLSIKMNSFLSNFTEVQVRENTSKEEYFIQMLNQQGIAFTSEVFSQGTLRILALFVLLYNPRHRGLLCIDEPENSISYSRMNFVAKLLFDLSFDVGKKEILPTSKVKIGGKELEILPPLRQVIVNTHSTGLLKQLQELLCEEKEKIELAQESLKNSKVRLKRAKPRKPKISVCYNII